MLRATTAVVRPGSNDAKIIGNIIWNQTKSRTKKRVIEPHWLDSRNYSPWTWKIPIFPQHQGTLCREWGGLLEKPYASLKHPSPTAATCLRFFFTSYFVSCLPNTWKPLLRISGCCGSHPTILTTVLDRSWYFGVCVFFSFLIWLANDGDMGKEVDIEGRWLEF